MVESLIASNVEEVTTVAIASILCTEVGVACAEGGTGVKVHVVAGGGLGAERADEE